MVTALPAPCCNRFSFPLSYFFKPELPFSSLSLRSHPPCSSDPACGLLGTAWSLIRSSANAGTQHVLAPATSRAAPLPGAVALALCPSQPRGHPASCTAWG